MSRTLPVIHYPPSTDEPRLEDETRALVLSDGRFVIPLAWEHQQRECGSCSMCCTLLAVDQVTTYGDACAHQRKHRGCAIYATRPDACRKYRCLWHLGAVPESMRPDKIKAVIEVQGELAQCVAIHVLRKHRDAWRSGELRDYIVDVAMTGLPVVLVCYPDRYLIGRDRSQFQIASVMYNPDGSAMPVVDHFVDVRTL